MSMRTEGYPIGEWVRFSDDGRFRVGQISAVYFEDEEQDTMWGVRFPGYEADVHPDRAELVSIETVAAKAEREANTALLVARVEEYGEACRIATYEVAHLRDYCGDIQPLPYPPPDKYVALLEKHLGVVSVQGHVDQLRAERAEARLHHAVCSLCGDVLIYEDGNLFCEACQESIKAPDPEAEAANARGKTTGCAPQEPSTCPPPPLT